MPYPVLRFRFECAVSCVELKQGELWLSSSDKAWENRIEKQFTASLAKTGVTMNLVTNSRREHVVVSDPKPNDLAVRVGIGEDGEESVWLPAFNSDGYQGIEALWEGIRFNFTYSETAGLNEHGVNDEPSYTLWYPIVFWTPDVGIMKVAE